jgi:hypothetical protein
MEISFQNRSSVEYDLDTETINDDDDDDDVISPAIVVDNTATALRSFQVNFITVALTFI